MNNTLNKSSQRFFLIDSLRGFAVINMVIFHLLYDVFEIYGVNSGWYFHPLTVAWERFICVSFILISGMTMNFSRHAYKRGIIVNLCGFLVTAVTVLLMPEQAIWFGVLNLIGCGMLICQALREYFDKFNSFAGLIISLLLFAFTYGVPNGYVGIFSLKLFALPHFLYSFKYLAFLGFPSADFMSTDYFSLIPWLFLFVAGYFLWKCIKRLGVENIFKTKIPLLDAVGRYSLWIYLAHQPVLVGVCMLIFGF